MDDKKCMFCEYNDEKRKNDLGETRCTKFSTFVNSTSYCDYFLSRGTAMVRRLIGNVIDNINEAEDNDR